MSVFSLLCNIIIYGIGYYGGKATLRKLSLKNEKIKIVINNGEKIFDKYGGISVFICKLLPFSKLSISLLAGVYKQNYFTFIVYSIVGILIANSVLVSLGFSIAINLDTIIATLETYKILILLLLNVSIVIVLMWKNKSKMR